MSQLFVPVFTDSQNRLLIPKSEDFGYETSREDVNEIGPDILGLFEDTVLVPHSVLQGTLEELQAMSIGEVTYEDFEFLIVGDASQ